MARLGIVGAKNSGKTTLVEQLIPRLIARGLRVTTIKHTAHNHSFDTPGKDSHRHREAGSDQTLTISSAELALFGQFETDLRTELEQLIERRSDICLVEGDKQSNHPKLLLTHNLDQLLPDQISHIVATYGLDRTDLQVPHLALNDIDQVAEFAIKTLSLTTNGVSDHV